MHQIIQPVVRALLVLQAMNQQPISTLRDLQLTTGLPKPTIHRLLFTLMAAGYVKKDSERGAYSLTAQVLSLSQGFDQKLWLVELGAPVAEEITRQVKWPVAIGVFDADAMVVRYSTRGHSPMTLRPSTVNQRFPMLESAMGQAYLGFCDAAEREHILELLRDITPEDDLKAPNRQGMQTLVAEIQRRGYGLRIGNRGESTHLAMPVRYHGVVQGVMGISVFASCYNEKAQQEVIPLLRNAIDKVELALKQCFDQTIPSSALPPTFPCDMR